MQRLQELLFPEPDVLIQPVPLPFVQLPMAYQGGLPRTVRPLLNANWFILGELVRVVKGFRDRNPSINAVRAEMLQEIAMLSVPAPFSSDVRFPTNVDYVCELSGNWLAIFQQLRSALSHKSENVGKKRVEGRADEIEQQSNSDAFLAFWTATTAILEKCAKFEDVFDRENFETHYQLRWA